MKTLNPVIHQDAKKFSEFKANVVLSAQKERPLLNQRKPMDLRDAKLGDPNKPETWKVL